jgi:hypothetical protein
MVDIADGGAADVNHAKLRVETRKWVAGRQRPMKYGERVPQTGTVNNINANQVRILYLDPEDARL